MLVEHLCSEMTAELICLHSNQCVCTPAAALFRFDSERSQKIRTTPISARWRSTLQPSGNAVHVGQEVGYKEKIQFSV